jgi:hypothetical protein
MTKGFLNVADEATAMARLVGANVNEIEDKSDVRLMLAINKLVIAEVVAQYTLIDEMLAEIIVRYFFDIEPDVLHFEKAWKRDKFKIFVHHILDAMFLLKKLSLVQAIRPVPSGCQRLSTELMPFVMDSLTASFPRAGKKITLRARSSMRAPISGPWTGCASSRTTQRPLTDISMTEYMDQSLAETELWRRSP